MVKCLESNEVPFYAIRDEEDKVPLLCDRTSIEQWRLAGKIHESTYMRLALLFFDIIKRWSEAESFTIKVKFTTLTIRML